MKISKLFHWLYGILMLLPILVFLPNAFYYGFNEQAVAQEKTELEPVYYESNILTNYSDFKIGNIYKYNDNYVSSSYGSAGNLCYIDKDLFISEFSINVDVVNVAIYYIPNSSSLQIYYTDKLNVTYSIDITNRVFNMVVVAINNYDRFNNVLFSHLSYTDYLYIKGNGEYEYSMSITDSMSYAWDSVWQNDLFSWSYESFLAEPFKYIGSVFGLPNDNSIYYCLSYWLDISIIWLCFDLIMYVPLLVHRWIDKGVLE